MSTRKLRQDCLAAAQRHIDSESTTAYDVARSNGDMFANVKHMRWFVCAVANQLIVDVKRYQTLKPFEA